MQKNEIMDQDVKKSCIQVFDQVCRRYEARLYEFVATKSKDNLVFTVYIYADKGVSLDLCESISQGISLELDRLDLIKSSYTLEVSSPGLERNLTEAWHYQTALGKEIKVRLVQFPKENEQEAIRDETFKKNLPNKCATLLGKLLEVTEEGLKILRKNSDQLETVQWKQIISARTIFNFGREKQNP